MSRKKILQKSDEVNGQKALESLNSWRDDDGLGSGEKAPDRGRFVSSVDDRGKMQPWADVSACLSHILAQSQVDEVGPFGSGCAQSIENKIKSFINHACIPDAVRKKGHHDIEVRPGWIRFCDASPGNPDGIGGGKRGKIRGMSRGSQKRLLQRLCSLEFPPEVFQTFTFSDDVVLGVLSDMVKGSSDVFHRFSQEVQRKFGVIGVHRREWIERKSGRYAGLCLPHYHYLFSVPGLDKKNYQRLCVKIARYWVKFTGTKDPKAEKVATHMASYDWIGDNYEKCFRYICKYITKKSDYQDMLTGRAWGTVGRPIKAKPVLVKASRFEMVQLKRLLKKQFKAKMRQAKRRMPGRAYKRILRMIQHGYGFLYISAVLFTKMFEFVRWKAETEVMEYFTKRGPLWVKSIA